MVDEVGTWQEDDRIMEHIIVDYFTNILRTCGQTDASAVVNVIQPRITEAMNLELCPGFQAEEVFRAPKPMHPKKSPDLDGMPPLFYEHYWSLVGTYVT